MSVINETQVSHSGRVSSVAYSSNNSLMVTACTSTSATELKFWNRATDATVQWSVAETVSLDQASPMFHTPGDAATPPSALHSDEVVTTMTCGHPEFGPVLAAGTDRGGVCILERTPDHLRGASGGAPSSPWSLKALLRGDTHRPITCLAFAPAEFGVMLAAGCSDGTVLLIEAEAGLSPNGWMLDNRFTCLGPNFSPAPVVAVSWRSHSPGLPPILIVASSSGASLWGYDDPTMRWERLEADLGVVGECSAVAWAPSLGRPVELLAAAGGLEVCLSSMTGGLDSLQVQRVAALQHASPVWQLKWNLLGDTLAASCEGTEDEPPSIVLWRPSLVGEWRQAQRIVGTPAEGAGEEAMVTS